MSKKITAIFDGKAFYPVETFHLEPNTKVQLTVETELIDEELLKMMANDPDVIREISSINQEFIQTEMDGLKDNEI